MYKQAIVNNLIKLAKTVVPEGFFNIADVNMENPFINTGLYMYNNPYAEAFERQREQLKFKMSLDKKYGLPTKLPTIEGPAGYFNITDLNATNPFDKLYQSVQYKQFEDQRNYLKMKADVAKEFESANAAVNKMRQATENLNNKFSRIEKNLAGVPSSQPVPTTNVPTTTVSTPKSNVPATGAGRQAVGGIGRTIDNFLTRNKWVAPAALVAAPLAVAGGAYLWNRDRRTYGAPTPGVGAFGQLAIDIRGPRY